VVRGSEKSGWGQNFEKNVVRNFKFLSPSTFLNGIAIRKRSLLSPLFKMGEVYTRLFKNTNF